MHASSIVKLFAALVAASSPALAELAMTFPVAGSSCAGGSVCQITWEDNHSGVSLAQQGNCTVALYTGGAQQQTFLQPIVFPGTVNVATTAAVEFTVDPTIGPNSDQYFIRISSTSLNQNGTSTTPQPYLSFSAKFSLTGMTGTFNQTVQNQISSAGSSSQVQTATSSRSTGASTTHSSTSASHSATTSHGAGFRDGVNGALMAGAAFFAGAVALF